MIPCILCPSDVIQVQTATRSRIKELTERWHELENAIEDHLNCARKEQRRSVQSKWSGKELDNNGAPHTKGMLTVAGDEAGRISPPPSQQALELLCLFCVNI